MKLKHLLGITATFLLIFFSGFIQAQINGKTTVCSGETTVYTFNGNANSYIWSVTGAISSQANGNSFTVEWGFPGSGW